LPGAAPTALAANERISISSIKTLRDALYCA
jgi:hypothetical protein